VQWKHKDVATKFNSKLQEMPVTITHHNNIKLKEYAIECEVNIWKEFPKLWTIYMGLLFISARGELAPPETLTTHFPLHNQ